LVAGLFFGRDAANAAVVLPPLEQAVNTASVVLLVWSLAPHPARYPKLFDILMIMTLILIGVMYLFFAQEWQNQAAAGFPYHDTRQAAVWTIFQIAVLAAGLVYLLFRGRQLGALPPIMLSILLLVYIVHFWSRPEYIPADTNIAYWIRLGYLIVLPLWAVYAYQYAMTPLLESESKLQSSVARFNRSLDQAAQVIATEQPQRRIVFALDMINHLFDSSFAAIGLINEQDRTIVTFYEAATGRPPGEMKQWDMILSEQVTLSTALSQDRSTELLREGLGSRQLYAFFEAAGREPTSSLLIHPLRTNGRPIGFLVIPGPADSHHWTEDAKKLVPGAAHFTSQALANSLIPASAEPPAAEIEIEPPAPSASVPAAIVIDRVRVEDLEFQLRQAREALYVAEQKRKQAEANSIAAQKQARYLAAALRTIQSSQSDSEEPDQEEPAPESPPSESVQNSDDLIV
jgi:heme/copper-type cytochrome/quinol oxidase subunit 2